MEGLLLFSSMYSDGKYMHYLYTVPSSKVFVEAELQRALLNKACIYSNSGYSFLEL